jgi:hypothetical protein
VPTSIAGRCRIAVGMMMEIGRWEWGAANAAKGNCWQTGGGNQQGQPL